ncbi:Enhancer of polycomb protein [Fasciola gigantica]|uniref:Enhancer of polycomb-like protein n=1 Tax=Fasciola gigantica TaxID=46835 RepID=A0A504YJT2_FASGI|nr:Enhancer of polycomb protein [Fasciola gigantica]
MSKVSFRARQIDFNKPLPILKNGCDILTEFSENALVNRGVPQIPSGMEKEEENEHHFVEAIHALSHGNEAVVKIPVPDIVDKSSSYSKLYSSGFSLPKQLVHIRTVVLAEDDTTEYDMDTEDEDWLNKSDLGISPLKFELMIDRLERGCGQKVMNLEEAKYLLQDDPSLVIAVYDYWLNKRVQSRQPLLFAIRQERRDGGSNADPYVAFRRRSEKMQTRKNRKNDEQSYEKMLILRDQMEALGAILSNVVKREVVKEALIQCELRCFQTRYKLRDWDGSHVNEAENITRKSQPTVDVAPARSSKSQARKRPSRKRKLTQRALNLSLRTQSSEDVSDGDPSESNADGPFAFVRTPGCRYLKPRDPGLHRDSSPNQFHAARYSLVTVPSVCHPKRHVYTGYIRRRLGRGGRIIYDRLRPPSHLVECLKIYDEERQRFLPEKLAFPEQHNTPDCRTFPSIPRSQCRDEALLHRLKPLVLGSHCSRPSYNWPICTDLSTIPSFEPLHPGLGQFSAISAPFSRSSVLTVPHDTTTTNSLSKSPNYTSKTNGTSETLDDLTQCPTALSLDVDSPTKETNGYQSPVRPSSVLQTAPTEMVPQSFDMMSAPHRVWKKLARPCGVVEPLQPSEFARSRAGDASSMNSNGFGARSLHSSDDRLLLTDPSVLSPPKTFGLARDCIPRDPKVPGPQLQTANGVSPSHFCQLPT